MRSSELIKVEIEKNKLRMIHLKEELRNSQIFEAKEKYGIEVGTLVLNKGIEYKISSFDRLSLNKPWLRGIRKKKDGSWGKKEYLLYSEYEVVK